MLWPWCLACFIIGTTCGAGLTIFILLTGTQFNQRNGN